MNPYSINELYEFTPEVELRTSSRINALTAEGALNDAEFHRYAPLGAAFTCRSPLRCPRDCFEGSNTALVVLTGVGKAAWSSDESRKHPWYARRGYWTPTTSAWIKPSQPWTTGSHLWAGDAVDASHAATAVPRIDKAVNKELPEYILGFDSLRISGLGAQIYIGHVEGLDGPRQTSWNCPTLN